MKNLHNLIENPTFSQIEEPVALYFSYVDADKYAFYKKNKYELVNLHNSCKRELAEYLKKYNYPVVTDDSLLAAHPATMVVSARGIQTPFIAPQEAKTVALAIAETIENSGFARPLSKIFAIRLEQLPAPELYPQQEKTLFTYLRHPDGRLPEYIKHRYGKNFIQQQRQIAWSWGDETAPMKKHRHNIANMAEHLYSGRKFTILPFYSYARNDMESRYQVFATPSYKHATKFCGGDELFGLIHHFHKMPNQLYFESFALETNGLPQTNPLKQIETIVVPKLNDYLGLEMYMGERRYMIPDQDERWIVFKEYCRAAYVAESDIMKQRRLNILREAKENGGIAVTYFSVKRGIKDLSLDKYQRGSVGLEGVLIDTQTPIRKEFQDFLINIENAKEKVSALKMPQTQQEKEAFADKEPSENIPESGHVYQTR